jgi:MFS family permease
MSPAGPNASQAGGNPNRTYTPSRPRPGTSYVGALQGSRALGAVAAPIAPTESLFSGNLRRFWMGEVFSTAGDVVLGAGVVIWYFEDTYSQSAVALLLLAFAIPAALVALFSGALAGVKDARRPLGIIGFLRVALAGLFIALHAHPSVSQVVALVFGLSLASSVRGGLRRAGIARGVPLRARGRLASGDQFGAGVLAVAGPALATLLYLLNGERIFTIAAGAALCYGVALINESQAEPLPDKILFQRAAGDDEAIASVWDNDEDEANSRVMKAEEEAQVWELAAAPSPGSAMRDVDDGLRVVGTSSHALIGFVVLTFLAAVGGLLAIVEPFYLWHDLSQVPFMLGLLFTATGLGAAIASAIVVELRAAGRFFMILGLLGSGLGLWLLPAMHDLSHAFAVIALIGAANVFAIRGGQMTMLRHFVPVGQRAVASAYTAVRAVAPILGIAAGPVMLLGVKIGRGVALPALGLDNTLRVGGVSVIIAGSLAFLLLIMPNRLAPEDILEPLPDDAAWDDDEYGEDSAAYSRYRPAPGYADSRRYTAYSAAYPAYTDENVARRGRGRRDDDDADWETPPPRRRR